MFRVLRVQADAPETVARLDPNFEAYIPQLPHLPTPLFRSSREQCSITMVGHVYSTCAQATAGGSLLNLVSLLDCLNLMAPIPVLLVPRRPLPVQLPDILQRSRKPNFVIDLGHPVRIL